MKANITPDAGDPAVRSPALDLARGGAALLVLISHARSMVLGDVDGGRTHSIAENAFYAVTGLGHQAVVIFFVISGLLVTRSIARDVAAERWSVGSFALARLTRLWVVLLPCLAIVAALDRLGLAVSGIDPARYGLVSLEATRTLDLSWSTLIANALFLQTIAVPAFGSDGPLWSLANEAWYYTAAGLCCAGYVARAIPGRAAVLIACALLLVAVLPRAIVQLAPIWMVGAALALVSQRAPIVRHAPLWQRMAGTAAFFACLLVSRLYRSRYDLGLDYALGACTVLLLAVSNGPTTLRRSQVVGHLARWAARRSYSLYLIHCPVLAFVTALLLGTRHLAFGAEGVVTMALASVAALISAEVVWRCFEQHTEAVRNRLSALLTRFTPLPACSITANTGIGQ